MLKGFIKNLVIIALWLCNGTAALANQLSIYNNLRPESYDLFYSASKNEDLSNLIGKKKYIYLRPGIYRLNNPVVIDSEEVKFIHGGDRVSTIIRPVHPQLPLFIIKNTTLVNFTGIHLLGAGAIDSTIIDFQNPRSIQFEMQDCFVDSGVINMQGPGTYRFQGVYVNNRGKNHAPLIVDNKKADFIFIGGNMKSGAGKSVILKAQDIYNVWQKQGRVRIIGTGIQYSIGKADFRIDSPSGAGPHVLAYIRSEGTNGYQSHSLPSSLLYVPPSEKSVDVLLMANGGSWPRDNRKYNNFVNYNATGTLWLIGNSSLRGANRLVVGKSPKATVYAIGNRMAEAVAGAIAIKPKKLINLGNMYSYHLFAHNKNKPYVRFLPNSSQKEHVIQMPTIPEVAIPDPLPRPRLNRALPGMLDVRRDFGAKGDGLSDDTESLQKAFITGKLIYLPKGRYRITKPLGFSHSVFGGHAMGEGGWIAGAGRGKTIIFRDVQQPGTVFTSEGMGYITIQGIGFVSKEYAQKKNRAASDATVMLEYNPRFKGAFATQEVLFYDCLFQGGKYGVSIGMRTNKMGSENMFINSEFNNAGYGLAIGSYNALNNIVYGSQFVDNDITIGHDRNYNTGGTAALLKVTVSGTKDKEIELVNSAGSPWFFDDVKSDTSRLFNSDNNSKPFYLLFDNCKFTAANKTKTFIRSYSGGGFYFIHSLITAGAIDLSSKMSVLPFFLINSKMAEMTQIQLGANGRLFQIH